MQRYFDMGSYSLGNIVKGHPLQNSKTRWNMHRKHQTELAAAELQKRLDAVMFEESSPDLDDLGTDEEMVKLGIKSSHSLRYQYQANGRTKR